MSNEVQGIILMMIGSFLIGFSIGALMMANQWAANATRCARKEWRGRIYKVSYDEDRPFNPYNSGE